MTESDILTVKCPCCGEIIPVRIDLKGRGVDEGLVEIDGNSSKDGSFPIVELMLDVDLEGLKDGGLDELIKEKQHVDELLASVGKRKAKNKN